LITGGLTFQTEVDPGSDLLIIGRFHAQDPAIIDVNVNGQDVGRWRYPSLPGEWLESAIHVPAEYLKGETAEIQLTLADENPPGFVIEPYYLWIWQGDANPLSATPEVPIDVQFEGGLNLIGYDYDLSQYKDNGRLPLQLYWQADEVNDIDAVLFIHLLDANGELVAQVDQRPYFGTRPPYTWHPGEVLRDSQLLELPAKLPSGSYQLVMGLYHPQTLDRLEIVENGLRDVADNLLFLQIIKL
jgi:hypothetical protein